MTEMTRELIQKCLAEQATGAWSDDSELSAVASQLSRSSRAGSGQVAVASRGLPSRTAIIEMVESIRSVLFPEFFGFPAGSDRVLFQVGMALDHGMRLLREQLNIVLGYHQDQELATRALKEQCVRDISRGFMRNLCRVQSLLETDAQAALSGDPAATSAAEIALCYPGLFAMTNYRLAHELHRLGVPVISRIITEHAHSITGIDIHPGAQIGESFFIDHGTGVVIGETSVIGNRVRLYHGVTLGAKTFQKGEDGALVKGAPRHPIVEDDVVIYAGATVLGRITIGRGSVIGGNVWLTHSVPPGSVVTQGKPLEQHRASDGKI